MNHAHESDGGCPAAVAQGSFCPGANVFAMLGLHLDFVRNLSLAAFAGLLAALAFALFLYFRFTARTAQVPIATRRIFFASAPGPNPKFLSWLSLHENSPAFA